MAIHGFPWAISSAPVLPASSFPILFSPGHPPSADSEDTENSYKITTGRICMLSQPPVTSPQCTLTCTEQTAKLNDLARTARSKLDIL